MIHLYFLESVRFFFSVPFSVRWLAAAATAGPLTHLPAWTALIVDRCGVAEFVNVAPS